MKSTTGYWHSLSFVVVPKCPHCKGKHLNVPTIGHFYVCPFEGKIYKVKMTKETGKGLTS